MTISREDVLKQVSSLTDEQKEKGAREKQQIRAMIANIYDLQKLRIGAGNRMVQAFYASMGVAPSTSPYDETSAEDKDKEEKKMISAIKKEFGKITNVIYEIYNDGKPMSSLDITKANIRNSIKKIQNNPDEKDKLKYIVDLNTYQLYDSYNYLYEAEKVATDAIDEHVKAHPLWDAFFKDIKGCGTLMSAVCIAYLDPYKARHVSSFFKYCGLDTVQDEDKEGNKLFLTQDGNFKKVREKMGYLDQDGVDYFGKVKKTDQFTAEGEPIFRGEDGEVLTSYVLKKNVAGEEVIVYEDPETLEEYIGDVVVSQHGRRKGDTEMFEYIDKDGNKQLKRGITYNPIVKTKLMGVLTGCLMKAKDPFYSECYKDYRARLENSAYHKNYSKGRINMMAQRYMIKQFLRHLWVVWRQLEGLEVDNPYEVEKLGHKPHKYNEYQCQSAAK